MGRRLVQLLIRALLMGLLLGTLTWMVGLNPDFRTGALICTIFAAVMWSGFELSLPFYRPRRGKPPDRETLRTMARASLLYLALLALSVALTRLATGVNLIAHPIAAALTFCLGFAVTNFIMAKHAFQDLLEAEGARAKAEARAGLLALQSQLQPHTLFNALNTIAALIPEDPGKAEAGAEALSRLLRRIMAAFERERWTLAEEFSVLEDLLALERLRFGERLQAQLDLDPAEAEREIAPLLLLPLVENALKHGFRPKVGPCSLNISARAGVIRVEDDGVGRKPEAPEGLGLRTVRERLDGLTLGWPRVDRGCAVELRR
jgi:two-component sensor histidine kinase